MSKYTKKMPIKINKGTLIAIPAGNGKFALSQVYYPGIVFYIVVYEGLWCIKDIVSAPKNRPILASWTNDAEIYRGRWILVGESVFEVSVSEPKYKVIVEGKEMAESFDGKNRWPLKNTDGLLKNRKSRSPLLLEDAVLAFYGLSERPQSYDDILVESPSL